MQPFEPTTENKFENSTKPKALMLEQPATETNSNRILNFEPSQSRAAPTLLPFTILVEQPKAHVLVTLFLLLLLLLRLLFFRSFRCRGGPCTA